MQQILTTEQIGAEEAKPCFAQIQPVSGELSDDDPDNVAGGGCGKIHFNLRESPFSQRRTVMQQYDHRFGLKQLFDSQRFYRNRRLQALIEDVENRYGNLLSDDDLSFVNAAGEADTFRAIGDAHREEIPK